MKKRIAVVAEKTFDIGFQLDSLQHGRMMAMVACLNSMHGSAEHFTVEDVRKINHHVTMILGEVWHEGFEVPESARKVHYWLLGHESHPGTRAVCAYLGVLIDQIKIHMGMLEEKHPRLADIDFDAVVQSSLKVAHELEIERQQKVAQATVAGVTIDPECVQLLDQMLDDSYVWSGAQKWYKHHMSAYGIETWRDLLQYGYNHNLPHGENDVLELRLQEINNIGPAIAKNILMIVKGHLKIADAVLF